MFRRLHGQRGITIIETTVILSVLFILAGALSPIVSESVTTARAVKAKNDAAMIAMGLINFQRDLGADALWGGGAAQALHLPDVLASAGTQPPDGDDDAAAEAADLAAGAMPLLTAPGDQQGRGNRVSAREARRAERRRWREVSTESLDDHLTTNRRGYRNRRPGDSGGWGGPYISGKLKGDPWGNRYLINSRWLDGGVTPADSQGRTRRAVFVVSPGANGAIDTPYEQPIVDARAFGDDIVIRLQ